MDTMAAERPYRVTVVCTGNICRSPMGEFVLRERFDEAGLDPQFAEKFITFVIAEVIRHHEALAAEPGEDSPPAPEHHGDRQEPCPTG